MTHRGIRNEGQGLALAGALLLLYGTPARAEPPKPTRAETVRAAQVLAAKIDEHFARRWKDHQIQSAPLADDAEFLRRIYLDLAGRIPSAGEARRFLDDKKPDKRQRLVDDLLNGPAYVTHWVNVWQALLLPEIKTLDEGKVRFSLGGGRSFEAWLRKELVENVGYDTMVRELLTAPVDQLQRAGTTVFIPATGGPSPVAFYSAKEGKPENLAASTVRLFLGLRVECAQCHDHPFAKWKREQFWNQAAFFAGLETPGAEDEPRPFSDNPGKREITIPGVETVAKARFLDGSEPKWQDQVSARRTLADWITSPKNPYFARAAANRLWAYLLGTGLIDPVDEMDGEGTQDNDPGGLLDELARALIAHDFDLKFLMRAITASKAYQLTSARTHASQDDPRFFARMTVRGLTAAQLFDSLALATGYREESGRPIGIAVTLTGVPPRDMFREQFLSRFADLSDKATESQTSIQQALMLMNGQFMADATSLTKSRTVNALADFPHLTTSDRIEALYLAALARKPRSSERERMVKYVEQGGAAEEGNQRQDKARAYTNALADVLWVLLNSAEFQLNH